MTDITFSVPEPSRADQSAGPDEHDIGCVWDAAFWRSVTTELTPPRRVFAGFARACAGTRDASYSPREMSRRAHLVLRVIALCVILACALLPRSRDVRGAAGALAMAPAAAGPAR
jgi:hypothetical protein